MFPTLLPWIAVAAASEAHERPPMGIIDHLTPNGTVFVQMAVFGVVFVVLKRFLFTPMLAYLQARERQTVGGPSDAERLLGEIERKGQEIETTLAQTRAKGQALREELRQGAVREAEAVRHTAREAAHARTEAFRAGLARQVETARRDIRSEAAALSGELAAKLLGRSVGA